MVVKAYRTGWIRRLIYEATYAADDLYRLDRDMHEPDPDCSWCRQRIALKRAAAMARKQIEPIETARLKQEFRR